ncbi:tetratricopeptide repeat protein [Gorillibacterium massiliense]|uniref:tetratricopeptide repeat protein n=1 Tax=Gorillibacterium massiliense TaxID=1280390 RepID=UPI0004B4686C|nr:tetratricopeptide repeat protein [Gorillibacterium massiliense]
MVGADWIRKAYHAILAGDFEQAAICFEEAVSLEPENAEYHHKLSVTYSRSGRLERALSTAQKAVKLDPDNQVYKQQMQQVKSKELLAKASVRLDKLTAQPATGDLGNHGGILLPLSGDGLESELLDTIVMLRKAIHLDPLSGEAYLLLAVACGAVGDDQEAVWNVSEALRLNPGLPDGKRLYAQYSARLANRMNEPEHKRRNDHGQLYH